MRAAKELDRRLIYLLVLLALCAPLVYRYSVPPARMDSAEKFFEVVKGLQVKPGEVALVAMDFGPNIIAENGPQAEVIIEHLMRKRVPIALFSIYSQAEPFLVTIPEDIAKRLMQEFPGERWEYGKDWVNLGYRPGGFLIVQAIPKSENLVELFSKDVRGNKLSDLPAFRDVKKLENIKLFAQFTGLVGTFDTYVQFLQKKTYRPVFGHGCTSITIPEAYIYLDSGQIKGLLEGIAGAAWYSALLNREYPGRKPDRSGAINTGLGIAHLVVILLVVLGNLATFLQRRAAHV